MNKKRRLLGIVKSKADVDLLLTIMRREQRGYTYDVVELPTINDPTDIVYEFYATTPTDWRNHKRLLAFFTGAATALGHRPIEQETAK